MVPLDILRRISSCREGEGSPFTFLLDLFMQKLLAAVWHSNESIFDTSVASQFLFILLHPLGSDNGDLVHK